MADYQALKNEVSKPEFVGQTSAQVATTLNALTVPVPVPVQLSRVATWAAKTGARAKIEAAAINPAHPLQGICLSVRDMLQGLNGPPLDLSNADVQAMLGALIAGGIIASSDGAALSAMGQTMTSRALALAGWDIPVSSLDVDHARAI